MVQQRQHIGHDLFLFLFCFFFSQSSEPGLFEWYIIYSVEERKKRRTKPVIPGVQANFCLTFSLSSRHELSLFWVFIMTAAASAREFGLDARLGHTNNAGCLDLAPPPQRRARGD